MPYTGPGDDSLPDYVQDLSESKRRQWVAVFNDTYDACLAEDGDADDCEASAFIAANGTVDTDANQGSEDSNDDGQVDDRDKGVGDYLKALYKNLKGKVDKETWDEAVKSARGHAGGKASARSKRKRRAESTAQAYEQWVDDPDYGDYAVVGYNDATDWTPKLQKADDAVNYREADEVGVQCSRCKFWEWGACRLVEGQIDALNVCDLWEATPNYATEDGESLRLFADIQKVEGDGWIPYLPKPGTYEHGVYGDIIVTAERNARFADQFNNGIYQEYIPVDAEHETKLSGAVGWITKMRTNEDGSVDAWVDWTERGRSLLADDGFRYVSPEWYDTWTDPATRQTFEDVAVGCALTTRPYFKGAHLRPLVASEDGLSIYEGDVDDLPDVQTIRFVQLSPVDDGSTEGQTNMSDKPKNTDHQVDDATPEDNDAGDVDTAQMSEANAKRFAELERENATLKSANETLTGQVDKLTGTVDRLITDQRRAEFTDIVMGRKGPGEGVRWFGEPEAHVDMLMELAEIDEAKPRQASEGDEDAPKSRVETYIASQVAQAKAMETSGVFDTSGSDGTGSGNATADPVDAFDAKVQDAIKASEGKLTYEAAMNQVAKEDPALYADYRAASYSR